jgi:hypothetical protein
VIELPEDIRSWIVAGHPTDDAPRPEPITVLAFVPPVGDTFWAIDLDEDQRDILTRCDGEQTGRAIADAAARARGVRTDDVLALLAAWVREGALVLE